MNCRCNNQEPFKPRRFIDLVKQPAVRDSVSSRQTTRRARKFFIRFAFSSAKPFEFKVDDKGRWEFFSQRTLIFPVFQNLAGTFSKYVEMMCERFSFDENSQVIKIASNDVICNFFWREKMPSFGNQRTDSKHGAGSTWNIETDKVFGVELATLKKKRLQTDLLLGNNVLAHTFEHRFVAGLNCAQATLYHNGISTFVTLWKIISSTQFMRTFFVSVFAYKILPNKKFADFLIIEEIPDAWPVRFAFYYTWK